MLRVVIVHVRGSGASAEDVYPGGYSGIFIHT